MPQRTDLIYEYDGSLEGMYSCIFESFEKKELPMEIRPEGISQTSLYPVKYISTDLIRAERVKTGIRRKISRSVQQLTELVYYTCHPEKEMLALRFVRLGMRCGAGVETMYADETVHALTRAVKHLTQESHQLKGFVRFSIREGIMTSVIEPKNFVLPLLEPHFCDRYAQETFLIYDKTHQSALFYRPGQSIIAPVPEYEQPEADDQEMKYRSLWKAFYQTIAISSRYNPRCRMSHMQKRYWSHLVEMDESIPTRWEAGQAKKKLCQSGMEDCNEKTT